MAGNIFINYRRGDDPGFTQALYSRLEQVFPPERLFMDVDNIAPGLDFVQVLNDQVARCDVLVAVIGKNWLGAADETGERRLDNPEDFVRVEIESALAQKKRVIPVLVNDARMPRSTELPESLRPFARCNAVRLTHERFRADTQSLIKALEQVLIEADAAGRTNEENVRRESKAKEEAEAERLRQERHERSRRRTTKPAGEGTSFVDWIAGLPSKTSWAVPFATVAVLLLGWILPWPIFNQQLGLGEGLWPTIYSVAGLIVIALAFYMRRKTVDGAELAVYWFAAISFLGIGVVSLLAWLGLGYSIEGSVFRAASAIFTAAALIATRRSNAGGLELAVYWLGIAVALFWAIAPLVVNLGMGFAVGTYFSDGASWYDAVLITLAAAATLSALAILLWRRFGLEGPEIAIYSIGIAYMLYVVLPRLQAIFSA
jgi:TIR domain-containing protein